MGQQEAGSGDCASLKYCLMAGFCKRYWKGSKFGGRKFTAFSGTSAFCCCCGEYLDSLVLAN